MKTRRVITLTVFLSFFFLALSGIMLFLSPQGRVAYWAGWTLFGLGKDQYSAIHTTFMVLFLTVGIWHIILNWKPITGYLKNRSKEIRVFTPESSVAMALAVLFLVGPLTGLPPFKQFLDAGEGVKAYWETRSGSPPWGHAEENTLDRFCRGMEDFERLEHGRRVSIDCESALAELRDRGLSVTDLREPIIDIARTNGITPQDVAKIISAVAVETLGSGQETQEALTGSGRFLRPYSGLGRRTLEEYAEEFGHDLDEILQILSDQGLEVDPLVRLREEAARLDLSPEEIIERLNGTG